MLQPVSALALAAKVRLQLDDVDRRDQEGRRATTRSGQYRRQKRSKRRAHRSTSSARGTAHSGALAERSHQPPVNIRYAARGTSLRVNPSSARVWSEAILNVS